MNKIQRGSEAEAYAFFRCVNRGYKVSLPTSHDCKYDLIFDDGRALYRCQIKRAYHVQEHDKAILKVETRRISNKGVRSRYSKSDFDLLLAVDINTYRIWEVPVSVMLKYKAQMPVGTMRFNEYLWS